MSDKIEAFCQRIAEYLVEHVNSGHFTTKMLRSAMENYDAGSLSNYQIKQENIDFPILVLSFCLNPTDDDLRLMQEREATSTGKKRRRKDRITPR